MKPSSHDFKPKAASGRCYLVGAGPGDLGLVTLRARELVELADTIVCDYLANPRILGWSKPGAEIVHAGKQAGQHTLTQDQINALLVEKTRAGRQVVRLKGGDPFVFGRGGEEALALADAGLPFEIVPGVTSAIAGPAYAGIPVTHRKMASSVTFVTGNEDPGKSDSAIDYETLARDPGAKVFLMGMERVGAIAERLMAAGLPGSTPAAAIRWATTPRQETLVSDLQHLAQEAAAASFAPPAIIIVGETVRLRERIAWYEKRPLTGKRIVVTRTREQAGALSRRLEVLGAEVDELPTIRIEPPPDLDALRDAAAAVHTYDWLVFTSPNGVRAFFEQFFQRYNDAREIGGVRIAAIGPATATEVRRFHLTVDLQPAEYIAEGVVEAILEQGSVENLTFLLPRAETARDVLPDELTKRGAIVDVVTAYRTAPESDDLTGARARLEQQGADYITFTSSSTVENFAALSLAAPRGWRSASIGPVTSQALRHAGFAVDVEAAQHDIPGLVEAILHDTFRA